LTSDGLAPVLRQVEEIFMQPAPFNIVPLAVVTLIGWRIITRIRRNIGRQPLNPNRMTLRIALYALLTVALAVISLVLVSRFDVFLGLLGGLLPGAALGLYGLHLTRFENTPEGRFYTPNPYMGAGLSLLLVGRLGYRLFALTGPDAQSRTQPQLMQSPLTMVLFGLLAGYYIAYFAGVLVRSSKK
jgi:xanthine/uracil permease